MISLDWAESKLFLDSPFCRGVKQICIQIRNQFFNVTDYKRQWTPKLGSNQVILDITIEKNLYIYTYVCVYR